MADVGGQVLLSPVAGQQLWAGVATEGVPRVGILMQVCTYDVVCLLGMARSGESSFKPCAHGARLMQTVEGHPSRRGCVRRV